ncbi:hypothetical protein [uncultured Desulfobacter sp.]|uniref:hypothetical protein n=1 Tax=uncultured Desulfobacter sp. TaxID=240139 RepID=UPI0029F4AF2B|nr:hypothetical protein [uncultured Desulfobacter sp.]
MAVLFYKQLVQYETETIPLTETVAYTVLMRDGLRRGGIVNIPWEDVESEWVPYVAVKDIGSMTAKVKELGCTTSTYYGVTYTYGTSWGALSP